MYLFIYVFQMYVVTKKETRTLITIKSGKSNKKRGNMFLKIHVNSSEVSPVDDFFLMFQ